MALVKEGTAVQSSKVFISVVDFVNTTPFSMQIYIQVT